MQSIQLYIKQPDDYSCFRVQAINNGSDTQSFSFFNCDGTSGTTPLSPGQTSTRFISGVRTPPTGPDVEVTVLQPFTAGVYERVEMFDDESVEITQSIKNVRDISKVFTSFTKQFSVPATKNNNLIFKHYYNFDIDDGFDARTRRTALIELNYLPFKKGKLRLDGVDMRDNKPYAYKLTFFGSIVELKDVIGEDKLPSLDDLDINFEYGTGDTLNNLLTLNATDSQNNVQTGISLPLITHSQRLYHDSQNPSEQSGNIHWNSSSIVQGVKHRQLKYAARLDRITDAIESKYDEITFASDSFFHDTTKDIHKIYMWCHRKTGQVDIQAGNQQKVVFQTDNFGNTYLDIDVAGNAVPISNAASNHTLFFLADILSTSRGEYDLIIKKNGNIEQVYEKVQGTISPTYSTGAFSAGDQYTAFIRTYDDEIQCSGLTWQFHVNGSAVTSETKTATVNTFPSSYKFNIMDNMPEMKIIDFLSSLFKMFNLVAYVQDDDTIQVEPLDTYYARSRDQDITKHVDITKSQVNSAIPFKEIFFKYADTEAIIAKQHYQELSDIEWGGIEYVHTSQIDGDIYKVEPAFAHAKYEKLLDSSALGTDTGVQVGYYVNENEEAYGGKPLLLYIDNQAPLVDLTFVANDSRIKIFTYQSVNMPSNTETIDNTNTNSLHFSDELSEYTNTSIADDKNLFARFYSNYISNVFDTKNRITKVSAILPVSKIIDIELYDVIVIAGRRYRINSMKTNLKDGKTDFELINYYD